MSDRLFDVVKTNDDVQKIVRAVARGIDATDVQDALEEELGFDVEVDTIDWNTWSQIEISGGENETGVIITLVVKEIEVGFDRLTVGQEDADPTPPADDVREALARTLWEAAVGDNPEGVPGETWEELLAEEPVWAQGYYFQADAAMRAFEVRPHGTVTDAFAEYVDRLGVDANEEHDGDWWDGYRQAQRDTIRKASAALDAAREVHP